MENGIESWSFPLSSWAYNIKLRQMQLVLQLGFELQIYQRDEIPGIYWYVPCRSPPNPLLTNYRYLRYLSTTRYSHLERIYTFLHHRLQELPIPPSQAANQLDSGGHRASLDTHAEISHAL